MARRPHAVIPDGSTATKAVKPELSRVEWLAVVKMAETGLAVTEALGLVPDVTTAQAAVRKLRAAV